MYLQDIEYGAMTSSKWSYHYLFLIVGSKALVIYFVGVQNVDLKPKLHRLIGCFSRPESCSGGVW